MRALARYLARRPHDPDFAAFKDLPGEGLFLDVGGSIGQSALSFRIFNRRSPILSLEPLPSHRGDLEFVHRVISGHRFMIAGAGAESREATLFVPMVGGYQLSAESALDRDDAAAVLERLRSEGADSNRLHLKEVNVRLVRLDELGLDPDFVKVDVEGAELGVLEGFTETLARSQPILMIERSDSIDQVIELLSHHGYRPLVYEHATDSFAPFDDQPTVNVFFAPAGCELPGKP
ncbi:MAG: FkbM family methyltransferase [Solirubrobacterales bacterium]